MIDDVNWIALLPAYLLITTVAIAAVADLLTRRIPNILLAPALGLALLLAAGTGGITGLALAVAGLIVGIAIPLPLYLTRGMGAGDVKLLGVAGAFLGPYGALIAALMTFIAGAALAIAWLIWRAAKMSIELLLYRYADIDNRSAGTDGQARNGIAYAPAIAVGVTFTAWYQGWIIPAVLS
jgi:prepilin peptidase CpaA